MASEDAHRASVISPARALTHARPPTRSDRTRDAWDDRPTSSRAIVPLRTVGFCWRWESRASRPPDRANHSHSLMSLSPMKPRAEAAPLRRPFMYTRLRVKCEERTRERPGVSPHRHPALARSGPSRFDGLKCPSAFRWNANATRRHRDCGPFNPARDRTRARTTHPGSTGLYPSACLVQVRKTREDSTPAVRRKTESDVSPGSSVTPGRSSTSVSLDGPCNATILVIRALHRAQNPATPCLLSHEQTGTFRLILPEAIAIGVRFSHASCTFTVAKSSVTRGQTTLWRTITSGN